MRIAACAPVTARKTKAGILGWERSHQSSLMQETDSRLSLVLFCERRRSRISVSAALWVNATESSFENPQVPRLHHHLHHLAPRVPVSLCVCVCVCVRAWTRTEWQHLWAKELLHHISPRTCLFHRVEGTMEFSCFSVDDEMRAGCLSEDWNSLLKLSFFFKRCTLTSWFFVVVVRIFHPRASAEERRCPWFWSHLLKTSTQRTRKPQKGPVCTSSLIW